jgi:hypothetical protein
MCSTKNPSWMLKFATQNSFSNVFLMVHTLLLAILKISGAISFGGSPLSHGEVQNRAFSPFPMVTKVAFTNNSWLFGVQGFPSSTEGLLSVKILEGRTHNNSQAMSTPGPCKTLVVARKCVRDYNPRYLNFFSILNMNRQVTGAAIPRFWQERAAVCPCYTRVGPSQARLLLRLFFLFLFCVFHH